MIRVKITDVEHPHFDKIGTLKNKKTVQGDQLYVVLDDGDHYRQQTFVEKDQIKIIKE